MKWYKVDIKYGFEAETAHSGHVSPTANVIRDEMGIVIANIYVYMLVKCIFRALNLHPSRVRGFPHQVDFEARAY